MADVIPQTSNDAAGERRRMPAKPGSHVAYARGPELIVEWYDFGPGAPYESANLLIFDSAAQLQLARLMGLKASPTPDELAGKVAGRFDSYFEVQDFANAQGVAFRKKVDFQP